MQLAAWQADPKHEEAFSQAMVATDDMFGAKHIAGLHESTSQYCMSFYILMHMPLIWIAQWEC